MQHLLQRIDMKRPFKAISLLSAAIWLLAVLHLGELITASGAFGPTDHLVSFMLFSSAIGVIIIAIALVGLRILNPAQDSDVEAISEYINDGLLIVHNGRVVFANKLARKLVNSTAEPSLTPEVKQALEQTKDSHSPILYETVVDGRQRHFMVSRIHMNSSASHTDHNAQRQVFVFQDVTFLRENEEAKVNFIGTLSHEIKTPITSLAMSLSMLERMGYDPELVRIANSDVARLRVLLEDLLNVSKLKIVRSLSALQKQESNLTSLVNQTVKAVAVAAHEKQVTIETSIQPRPHIFATIDPTKISWVVTTLLTDAIRQTPPGKTVRVVLEMQENKAQFTVEYERRFDSLGPTGHAIVRDIIEAHAGTYTSLHNAGHRSVFKFSVHAFSNTTKGASSNEAYSISR